MSPSHNSATMKYMTSVCVCVCVYLGEMVLSGEPQAIHSVGSAVCPLTKLL